MSRLLQQMILIIIWSAAVFASEKKLKIFLPSFLYNSDPQTMIDARSMQINLQIHRGLFRYMPNGDIKSDLAESWIFSDDRRELTIKIKKAYFSDNSLITSHHIVNSFARLFLIESSMSADLGDISGIKSFLKEKKISLLGIKAKNNEDVVFKFDHPHSLIISQLAAVDCAILPIKEEQVFQSIKKQNENLPIGAGPYKIVKNTPNFFQLRKWRKDAFDSPNPPDVIDIEITDEKNIQKILDTTKTDSLDPMFIANELKEQLLSSGWQSTVTDMTREFFLIINPEKINTGARAWLTAKINITDLNKSLGEGYTPAWGFIPPVLPGAIRAPIKSNSQVQEHPPKEINVIIPEYWDEAKSIKTALLEFWKGVHIDFKEVNQKEWNQYKIKKNYDVLVNARGIDYPEGISILNYFRSGVEGNYYFIKDSQVDGLLRKATSEFNSEKRAKIYAEIQKIVLQKHIVYPLFFGSRSSGLWSSSVKNVPAHPLGYHFLPFEMIEMR